MHISANELIIIGSDNSLSPGRHQAIFWTNAGILLIDPLRTNFSEILIGIETFPFKKMHLKMSSVEWYPFCLSLNLLTCKCLTYLYCWLKGHKTSCHKTNNIEDCGNQYIYEILITEIISQTVKTHSPNKPWHLLAVIHYAGVVRVTWMGRTLDWCLADCWALQKERPSPWNLKALWPTVVMPYGDIDLNQH